jgi:outer membrane receptor for ferrienterochelin and colicins
LTVGGGYSIDEAQSTRYDNVENIKRNYISYGYLQTEWLPQKKWIVIAGIRYDYNSLFAAAFSPKLAVRYNASNKLAFTASIGRGFKAPDFRQLYLNFTNNAAGGYSVFGAIDAVQIINQMQSLGQISEIKSDFAKLKTLTPEFSYGLNFGAHLQIRKNINATLNLFRNDIDGLIDSRHVATKINGAQIFSYINIKKAFTQGGELSLTWKIIPTLSITCGYQFLQTADKDERNNIRSGNVFTRNLDGTSRLLQMNEYVGLANRSKHMGNLKFTYEKLNGFYATLRLNYRSEWYVADSDGNGVYNTNDEHAQGFVLANCSFGKKWKNGFTVYGGMDNMINHRDANYLPNVQGRMIYTGINYTIK